jgi:hypothetical protein
MFRREIYCVQQRLQLSPRWGSVLLGERGWVGVGMGMRPRVVIWAEFVQATGTLGAAAEGAASAAPGQTLIVEEAEDGCLWEGGRSPPSLATVAGSAATAAASPRRPPPRTTGGAVVEAPLLGLATASADDDALVCVCMWPDFSGWRFRGK